MPVEAGDLDTLLTQALGLVVERSRLDDMLGGLAALLSSRFEVTRLSLRIYDPANDELEIAGAWSVSATGISVGTRLPLRSTSFAEVERRGRALLTQWNARSDWSLLDRVLRDEGNRAWITAPIWRERRVVGLFTVSAATETALTEEDLPFFESLSETIGARLLEAAGA
jgi:hypothetical protein